jgi:antitoxin component of MazEF toxin-antitoxin module
MNATRNTTVKLKKVGNSQAVIIPSSFLKEVKKTSVIEMKIEENSIHLIFNSEKTLQELIEEKRLRNKGLMNKMMEKVKLIDPEKYNENYIINGADDWID